MKPIRFIAIAIGGLLMGAGVGVGLKMADKAEQPAPTTPVPAPEQLSVLPDFSYTDLDGRQRHSSEWKSRILVLNFWAAWCPPCREETPDFVELQQKYLDDNVKFVGIAIDDPDPVREFADTYGVDYPILLGDIKAVEMSRKLGNRFEGLPFTVVAEPGGKVVLRHAGGLGRKQLEPILRKLIEKSRRDLPPETQS
jgi:thiol-disulfide isomerase/thioredoxin